jgi:hypothetical protein
MLSLYGFARANENVGGPRIPRTLCIEILRCVNHLDYLLEPELPAMVRRPEALLPAKATRDALWSVPIVNIYRHDTPRSSLRWVGAINRAYLFQLPPARHLALAWALRRDGEERPIRMRG